MKVAVIGAAGALAATVLAAQAHAFEISVEGPDLGENVIQVTAENVQLSNTMFLDAGLVQGDNDGLYLKLQHAAPEVDSKGTIFTPRAYVETFLGDGDDPATLGFMLDKEKAKSINTIGMSYTYADSDDEIVAHWEHMLKGEYKADFLFGFDTEYDLANSNLQEAALVSSFGKDGLALEFRYDFADEVAGAKLSFLF